MKLGILGAGAIGQAVAGQAVRAGHEVVLSNRRGPASLDELVDALGPLASAGSVADAAACEVVVLAVPWSTVPGVLSGLAPWEGRILVDATNQFAAGGGIEDLGDQTGSELVASLAPGANVIKAFNTLFARVLAADPRHDAGRQVLFYAGDDDASKARFRELVESFGFAAIDTGPLRDGGRHLQIGGGFLAGLHVLRQEDV